MKINWKLEYQSEPSEKQVIDDIEKNYPSPGYGPSKASRPFFDEKLKVWFVFVESNDSCD